MDPLFIPRIVDKWIGIMRRKTTGEYNGTLGKNLSHCYFLQRKLLGHSPDNESGAPCRELATDHVTYSMVMQCVNYTNSWTHNPGNVGSKIEKQKSYKFLTRQR
jgi:hypothetical protein